MGNLVDSVFNLSIAPMFRIDAPASNPLIISEYKNTIMKKFNFGSTSLWNSVLLISVIFTAFVVPVLSVHLHSGAFNLAYTVIYISAIFSLKKRSKAIVILFFTTFIMQWISAIFKLELLNDVSKGLNSLFFIVVVVALILQIASAKEVSLTVILDSIAGYLLIGIVYSIFIFFIIRNVPDAYSNQMGDVAVDGNINASPPLYFSFVTIASLGYGDIVPLKPISRSLATLIAITGQFYMAIIVAMLIGKFISQRGSE